MDVGVNFILLLLEDLFKCLEQFQVACGSHVEEPPELLLELFS